MPTYQYPRPAVTVDAVVFTPDQNKVLLIRRKNDPFQDHWALPGGFIDENEAPETAVARELQEETGLTDLSFTPNGFWGAPGRDPRGHTISLAFAATLDPTTQTPEAADDAAEAAWHNLANLPPLAFDHAKIIAAAQKITLQEL